MCTQYQHLQNETTHAKTHRTAGNVNILSTKHFQDRCLVYFLTLRCYGNWPMNKHGSRFVQPTASHLKLHVKAQFMAFLKHISIVTSSAIIARSAFTSTLTGRLPFGIAPGQILVVLQFLQTISRMSPKISCDFSGMFRILYTFVYKKFDAVQSELGVPR